MFYKETEHYYFKFQTANAGLAKHIALGNKEVPLCIYYNDWLARDVKTNEEIYEIKDLNSNQKGQIKVFYHAAITRANVFFWLFDKQNIYLFKRKKTGVFDADMKLWKTEKSKPKGILFKQEKVLKKSEVFDFFAALNSNQGYNRRTIARLEGYTEEYANHLVLNTKPSITLENYFNFMSPTQFETLVFLILNQGENFCSSYRGSTVYGYDLRASIEHLDGFKKGRHLVQIKKQDFGTDALGAYTLIHLGKTIKSKNILGKDWIKKQIEINPKIKDWLFQLFHFSSKGD
ncbi:MAG: hypothetical protein JXQ87_14035 [Bacteroidia bacterium]